MSTPLKRNVAASSPAPGRLYHDTELAAFVHQFATGATHAYASQLIAAAVDRPTAFDHAGIWPLTFPDGQFVDSGCPGST